MKNEEQLSPFARVMQHVRKSNLTAFGVRIEENRYEVMAAWINSILMGGHDRIVLYLSMNRFCPVFDEMCARYKDLLTIVDATSMSIDDLLADIECKCKTGEMLFFVDVLWAFSVRKRTFALNLAMDTIRLKKFALEKGLTIIITKFLKWSLYDRDSLEYIMPMLVDFEDDDYVASIADCVFSLFTPSKLNVFQDENGNDLHGITIFRILKTPLGNPIDFKTCKISALEYRVFPGKEGYGFGTLRI